MKSLIYFLGIGAIIANTLDLLTTLIALSLGCIELNNLFYTLGAPLFFLIKIILPMTIICTGLILTTKYPNYPNDLKSSRFKLHIFFTVLFVCLIAVFSFAVINNIGVILQCHV